MRVTEMIWFQKMLEEPEVHNHNNVECEVAFDVPVF